MKNSGEGGHEKTGLLFGLFNLFFLCVSCKHSFDDRGTEDSTAVIKVFSTSDIHGYLIYASDPSDEATFQYRLAYLAKQVNEAMEKYDGVLLLNGENNYEETLVSNLFKGTAVRAVFDIMGYDATALGNHEFDWDNIKNRVSADRDATIEAYDIGGYEGDPDIPVLACNLYYGDDLEDESKKGHRVEFTKDYVIVEKSGKKIALIGYISDFSSQVMTTRIQDYKIDTDIDKLKGRIDEICEKEKPDITIVVSFAGAASLAEELDPDKVNLVTGGHGGSSSGTTSNGIAYISSPFYTASCYTATITIDEEGGVRVIIDDPVSIAATGPGADNSKLYDGSEELDSEVLSLSKAAWNEVRSVGEEQLGYVTETISCNVKVDDNCSVAGNWITGLMLEWAQSQNEYSDTIASFYNNGGIRSSLSVPDGESQRDVTASDIYAINPFSNYWYIYEATGKQLKEQIELGLVSGNFGNEMSGITYEYTKTEDGTDSRENVKYKYEVKSIAKISDGSAIGIDDETNKYKVCISNYSATLTNRNGTSPFAAQTPLNVTDAPIDNVTLIEVLRNKMDGRSASEVEITVNRSKRGD